MSHVDQVVKFIEANTAGAQLGTSESSGAADPFTGKSLLLNHMNLGSSP